MGDLPSDGEIRAGGFCWAYQNELFGCAARSHRDPDFAGAYMMRRDVEQRDEIIRLLRILAHQGEHNMATAQEILDALEAETDAGTAVVLLLDKVVADLAELKAGMDPEAAAKLDQALGVINANKDKWAQAALRNTHSG